MKYQLLAKQTVSDGKKIENPEIETDYTGSLMQVVSVLHSFFGAKRVYFDLSQKIFVVRAMANVECKSLDHAPLTDAEKLWMDIPVDAEYSRPVIRTSYVFQEWECWIEEVTE